MNIVVNCSHKFEDRYDFAKVGDVAERRYVRDICIHCGETVERPMTIRDRLELGIITQEEARDMLLKIDNPIQIISEWMK